MENKQNGRAITGIAFQRAWSTIFHAAEAACRTHLGQEKQQDFAAKSGLVESIALLPNISAEEALKFGVDNGFRSAKPGYTVLEWSAAYQSVRSALGFRPLVMLQGVSEISECKIEKKDTIPAKVPDVENPKAVALAKIVANVDELLDLLIRNWTNEALFYYNCTWPKLTCNTYALAAALYSLNKDYETVFDDVLLQKITEKFEAALSLYTHTKYVSLDSLHNSLLDEFKRALTGEQLFGPCFRGDGMDCAASRFASLAYWVTPRIPVMEKNAFYTGADRRKFQMVAMEAIEAEISINGKNLGKDSISSVVLQLFDMAMITNLRKEHDVSCRSLQLVSKLIHLSGKDKLDNYAHKDLVQRLPVLKQYANMKQVKDAVDEVSEALLAA